MLLSTAERGVAVRVLVDDVLIDTDDRTLLLLSAHPRVQIRIYNPNISVGVGFWGRIKNAVSGFREINQRMHDKTAIFDGVAGITGGRNMADEYFDYDRNYVKIPAPRGLAVVANRRVVLSGLSGTQRHLF